MRVKYGVIPLVRAGVTVTAGSVASIIWLLPRYIATLWVPPGP